MNNSLWHGGSHCCAIIYAYAVQSRELGDGETMLSTECQGKAVWALGKKAVMCHPKGEPLPDTKLPPWLCRFYTFGKMSGFYFNHPLTLWFAYGLLGQPE